jgi:hypothetical protein
MNLRCDASTRSRASRERFPKGAVVSAQGKPSIVFCHGLWADGSCFTKVMGPLQAEGYQSIAAQYGLDTPEGDVATVIRHVPMLSHPDFVVDVIRTAAAAVQASPARAAV